MSRVLEKVDNTLGLVLVGEAELGGKVLEIFGELHNMIPPAPNFYTSIVESNALNTNDVVVLNEHATVLCEVKDDQRHLVHQVQGSDFIFFQMMLDNKKNRRKYKKPICFDNRIESGLLSAIEENNFMRYLTQSRDNNVYSLPDITIILTQCLMCLRNAINLKSEFEEIYQEEFQRNLLAIDRQLKIVGMSLKQGEEFFKEVGTFIPGKENGFVICTCLLLAVGNIKTIGSLLVDVNILKTAVAQPEDKRVVVFTGFAHAFRLLSLLQNAQITFEAPNVRELIRHVKIDPDETVAREEAMLETLQNL